MPSAAPTTIRWDMLLMLATTMSLTATNGFGFMITNTKAYCYGTIVVWLQEIAGWWHLMKMKAVSNTMKLTPYHSQHGNLCHVSVIAFIPSSFCVNHTPWGQAKGNKYYTVNNSRSFKQYVKNCICYISLGHAAFWYGIWNANEAE